MRVLIGYDGSPSADAALEELKQAGLPDKTEVLIATVSDVWLPTTDVVSLSTALTARCAMVTTARLPMPAEQILEAAKEISDTAAARVKSDFPAWQVKTEIMSGEAGGTIIRQAAEWRADLIIVGSQNRLAFGRFFLGSVSQKIFIEAHCSVRVARNERAVDKNAARRIVAGIDDAESADLIIEAIAGRNWVKGSELTLLTATDTFRENAISPD